MNSSLSASQLHTVNMRDPLNRVLANLFLLISSILGSRTAGPIPSSTTRAPIA